VDAIGRDRIVLALDSKGGRIVVKGWQEATNFTAEEVIRQVEPYCSGFLCTYVDKEGMMQGTDLDWFRRLRAPPTLKSPLPEASPPSRTSAPSTPCASTPPSAWPSTRAASTSPNWPE